MAGGEITSVSFDHTSHTILTSAQMRRTEADAIAAGSATGLSMMECAGQGVLDALLQNAPRFAHGPQHALVLCGPGNNGGDGFVIARLLKQLGWQVHVSVLGQIDNLPPDAAHNARLWLDIGAVHPIDELNETQVQNAEIAFDALFGTGLLRALDSKLVEKLDLVAAFVETIVAVDIPSGINADSGKLLIDRPVGFANKAKWPVAHHIVTFQRMKPGHLFSFESLNPLFLSIVDLGIRNYEPSENQLRIGGIPKGLLKQNYGHKYRHGHALVLAGSPGKGGAGRLAAQAALRIGAGVVTLGCQDASIAENAAQLNAVMLDRIGDARQLSSALGDTRINALCLGPALGAKGDEADKTRALVRVAMASSRACVLDADALSVFEEAPDELFDMLHARVILTPHFGEFARLFPDLAAKLCTANDSAGGAGYSAIDAVREASLRAGCTILLKGLITVIANPNGEVFMSAAIAQRSVPWLSTAGAGDVLAGFICGLLARGFSPMAAGSAGVWIHIECARNFGPALIAEDLSEQVPAVLQQYQENE